MKNNDGFKAVIMILVVVIVMILLIPIVIKFALWWAVSVVGLEI